MSEQDCGNSECIGNYVDPATGKRYPCKHQPQLASGEAERLDKAIDGIVTLVGGKLWNRDRAREMIREAIVPTSSGEAERAIKQGRVPPGWPVDHVPASSGEAERLAAGEAEQAALAIMVALGPLVADAAIVGKTYGWREVLDVVNAAAAMFRQQAAELQKRLHVEAERLAAKDMAALEMRAEQAEAERDDARAECDRLAMALAEKERGLSGYA